MDGALIQARHLRVERDGRRILDVADLAVPRGEVLALVGANGAGKSTLLRVLALLERPTAGTLTVAGVPVTNRTPLLPLRRRMAVVFQDPLLLDAPVRENVAVGLRLRGLRGAEVERRVDRWLERLGIAHLARQHARTLSGGEAQRVSLARALVLEPEVLFLDEPTANLDLLNRTALISELAGLIRGSGMTAVLVSHDFREVLRLADRVAVLEAGRLVTVGTPGAVVRRPPTRLVRALVEAALGEAAPGAAAPGEAPGEVAAAQMKTREG